MIYAYYFIVKAGSSLDKRRLADPDHTYRAGATVFSASSMGWAEIRMGNININCKPDVDIDGAVDCENQNQQMLDRLSIQDRAELKN